MSFTLLSLSPFPPFWPKLFHSHDFFNLASMLPFTCCFLFSTALFKIDSKGLADSSDMGKSGDGAVVEQVSSYLLRRDRKGQICCWIGGGRI